MIIISETEGECKMEIKKSEKAVKLIDAAHQAWADGDSIFGTAEVYAECMCLLCDLYKAAKEEEQCADE